MYGWDGMGGRVRGWEFQTRTHVLSLDFWLECVRVAATIPITIKTDI